jgi:hypothetical protein
MKKSDTEVKGKRLLCRHGGALVRCVDVVAKGKTSCRFLVKIGFSNYPPHEYTRSEFDRCFQIVPEDYEHDLPATADRLRALIKFVDEECNGRIPYRFQHFTEIGIPVHDKTNHRTERDCMCQASPFGSRNWSLRIHLWGEDHIDVEATPEDMKESGGHTWPAFKKKILAMIHENAQAANSQILCVFPK